ncbi:MAG: hypothetical protein CFE24_09655 [Flavobacterium sp. BFFFF2]|nr:MAG: hypothetical protein CFE24_09655 [Flavobacterium sp. BFFFF2]
MKPAIIYIASVFGISLLGALPPGYLNSLAVAAWNPQNPLQTGNFILGICLPEWLVVSFLVRLLAFRSPSPTLLFALKLINGTFLCGVAVFFACSAFLQTPPISAFPMVQPLQLGLTLGVLNPAVWVFWIGYIFQAQTKNKPPQSFGFIVLIGLAAALGNMAGMWGFVLGYHALINPHSMGVSTILYLLAALFLAVAGVMQWVGMCKFKVGRFKV